MDYQSEDPDRVVPGSSNSSTPAGPAGKTLLSPLDSPPGVVSGAHGVGAKADEVVSGSGTGGASSGDRGGSVVTVEVDFAPHQLMHSRTCVAQVRQQWYRSMLLDVPLSFRKPVSQVLPLLYVHLRNMPWLLLTSFLASRYETPSTVSCGTPTALTPVSTCGVSHSVSVRGQSFAPNRGNQVVGDTVRVIPPSPNACHVLVCEVCTCRCSVQRARWTGGCCGCRYRHSLFAASSFAVVSVVYRQHLCQLEGDQHAGDERHASSGIGGAIEDQPPAAGNEVLLSACTGQQPTG